MYNRRERVNRREETDVNDMTVPWVIWLACIAAVVVFVVIGG